MTDGPAPPRRPASALGVYLGMGWAVVLFVGVYVLASSGDPRETFGADAPTTAAGLAGAHAGYAFFPWLLGFGAFVLVVRKGMTAGRVIGGLALSVLVSAILLYLVAGANPAR
jgi:hypothetical protein